MKICVTGAGGFLGRAVVKSLCADPRVLQVRALYSRPEQKEASRSKVAAFIGELSDEFLCRELVRGTDLVVHLAERGFPLDLHLNTSELIEKNFHASLVLLKCMEENGVRRIIYSSSGGAIYRNEPDRAPTPFSETSPLEFRSAYAVYKINTENLLQHYERAYGMQAYILRLSNPYGIQMMGRSRQGFIGVAFQRLVDGQALPIWGSLETVKDFIHVDDILSLFKAVIRDSHFPSGIYNVGSGTPTSLRLILETLERLSKQKIPCEIQRARKSDSTWTVLETSKIRSVCGWRCEIPLEKGLTKIWSELKLGAFSPQVQLSA